MASLPLRVGFALGLSGFAAVLYEVLWVRLLGDVFGQTALAVQVVLAVFFAGLAFGSWASDRLTSRLPPLTTCATLEGLLGLSALFLPTLIPPTTALYDSVVPAGATDLAALPVRLLAGSLLLFVPTALMGATFPLIVRWLQSRDDLEALASLYAVNTLGGAAGACLTAFTLLPDLGVTGALWVGAVANFAAALVLFGLRGLDGTAAPRHRSDPPAGALVSPLGPWALGGLLFLTGFLALSLEVLWFRALDQVLSGTIYSFGTVLAVFLLGIAAGGELLRRSVRSSSVVLLVRLELLLAAYVVLSPQLIRWSPEVARYLGRHLGLGLLSRGLALESLVCGLLLFVPAVIMGMLFPALLQLADPSGARSAWGRLIGANTAGAVAGAVCAGSFLLPGLGLHASLLAAAAVAAAMGLGVHALLGPAPRSRLPYALATAYALGAWLLPSDLRLGLEAKDRLVAQLEDPGGTVAVVDVGGSPQERRLKVNSTYAMGGGRGAFTERRMGHLPMLLHPAPRRVLVLGVGTGNTLGAVSLHRPDRLVAVELVPGVLRLAQLYFGHSNESVLENPRVTVLRADARRVVRGSRDAYDVVIADLFHPWQAGIGALYSREHFATVRARLAPGGVFCQWLPLHQLSREDLGTILRTFLAVFPDASAWLGNFGSTTPVLALVGSDRPVLLRWSRWENLKEDGAVRDRLRESYLDRPTEVFGGYVGGSRTLQALAGSGPLNTLAHPRIEFTAPRTLYSESLEEEKRRCLEDLLLHFEEEAVPLSPEGSARPSAETMRTHRHAVRLLIEAFLARERGDVAAALGRAAEAASTAEDYDVAGLSLVELAWEAESTRPDLAERAFRAALSLRPRDANALTGLGWAQLDQRRPGEAAASFRQALAQDPRWSEAVDGLREAESILNPGASQEGRSM